MLYYLFVILFKVYYINLSTKIDYPQRNSHGKWQIGEIELDSEVDKDYINSMLEFQEMMKSLSNTDNNNAAHHS